MRRILLTLITLFIFTAIFLVIRFTDSDTNEKRIDDNLTDRVIEGLITTTSDKKISVISKKIHNGGALVFYLDTPKQATEEINIDQTDIGFAFFKPENNHWVKEHGGEYGSINSYLKQSGQG